MSLTAPHAPHTRRWSRDEYRKIADVGIISPQERVELIEGEIVEMSPQNTAHATAITLTNEALRKMFGQGHTIRVQLPLALDPFSEPEPDVAVVEGAPRDYLDDHPSTAVLVVEVADTSLTYDRATKASLYARAGIPEYWILNLTDRRLEVYRNPGVAANQPFGYGYSTITAHHASEEIAPMAVSDRLLPVADLLP